ncbi:hypothetical protein T4D_11109, partial [Trichinella pseudospiralis]
LASQTMAVQDLSCHPLHILQKAMLVHDTEAMCIAFNCFNEDFINNQKLHPKIRRAFLLYKLRFTLNSDHKTIALEMSEKAFLCIEDVH